MQLVICSYGTKKRFSRKEKRTVTILEKIARLVHYVSMLLLKRTATCVIGHRRDSLLEIGELRTQCCITTFDFLTDFLHLKNCTFQPEIIKQ